MGSQPTPSFAHVMQAMHEFVKTGGVRTCLLPGSTGRPGPFSILLTNMEVPLFPFFRRPVSSHSGCTSGPPPTLEPSPPRVFPFPDRLPPLSRAWVGWSMLLCLLLPKVDFFSPGPLFSFRASS